MTAAWDRGEALKLADRLAAVTEDDAYAEPWALGVSCREAATLLRAAVAREDAAEQMAEALREIATSDEVDMLLDPTRASRIAHHAIAAWDAGQGEA